MPSRRYTRQPRRKKKKGGHFWAILILVIIIGLGMFLTAHKRQNPEETWPDVIEDMMPEPVKEKVKETLPEPVKKKVQEIKQKEKKEIQQEKAKKAAEQKEQSAKQEKKAEPKAETKPETKPKTQELPAPAESGGGDELPGLAAGQYSGKLAVLIDDCGYQLDPVRTLTSLPLNMTFAVIPFKTNSEEALSIIKGSGHTAMLHLPMQPFSGGSSESRSVRVGMTKQQIQDFTRDALDSLPGVTGVNNHQGSAATSNGPTIRAVLEVLKERGLFFVDSRTSSSSVAEQIAGEMGVPTAHNAFFLDNSSDVGNIEAQIVKAVKAADRYGSAIVICHARPNTAKAWQQCYQAVLNSGITMVSVPELLH
jgi:polysaccharide deacetylase 2 family uncharacterized protein YibQ